MLYVGSVPSSSSYEYCNVSTQNSRSIRLRRGSELPNNSLTGILDTLLVSTGQFAFVDRQHIASSNVPRVIKTRSCRRWSSSRDALFPEWTVATIPQIASIVATIPNVIVTVMSVEREVVSGASDMLTKAWHEW